MKKNQLSQLVYTLFISILSFSFMACGGDGNVVTVDKDGNASGGHRFEAIDEDNYFVDGVRYAFQDGTLCVSGYELDFQGEAKIISALDYNGRRMDVKSIGEGAFYECIGMTAVSIPESVTSIGSLAFSYCSGLTAVAIPEGVTSIEDNAFSYCSELTTVTIPESVTSIGVWAFAECYGLTSITIPKSVTSIGEGAFFGCIGLTNIAVAEGNTCYDSRNECNAIIETATNTLIAGCMKTAIPESVTGIGVWAFAECSDLTSIAIPEGVTSIGDRAFSDCVGLTSMTLPAGVTSIGEGAFAACEELKDFYCNATEVPSTDPSAFELTPTSDATLHVPASAVEAYKSDEIWGQFGTIKPIAE